MSENTGTKDFALGLIFESTGVHFQMVLETENEPGKRTFMFPFNKVLNAAKRLGQFDLTEEEILEKWWKPRYMNYAKALGVEFKISDLDENGRITVELVD